MSRERLFKSDAKKKAATTRCKELVPLPRRECAKCGGPMVEAKVAQPALLRHGGYGATLVTTRLECIDSECLATRFLSREETQPARPFGVSSLSGKPEAEK